VATAYDHLPVDDDVDTAPVVFWRDFCHNAPVAGNDGGRRCLAVLNYASHFPQYSQSIAQPVIQVLHREVLAAQGVHVNAISGATYTTEAYLYSVQSALTKLHF
jgi:FMN-binding domain